ncbi:ATP-binding cassette domain-containing protein [Amycolatopsis minnesotensis]|uniref:ABC transporter ATP-binding protein n=1 Tax=Amycolatopsis minnesotensis TaxID=337894 RepID=A0ABP5BTF8_9PSEU
MIEATGLVKRYRRTTALDGASFTVRPGVVTGFVGPNGAGKSTTMRLILGLDRPSEGSVTVGGKSYRELAAPLREVGALLEADAVSGRRSARDHLRWIAKGARIPDSRVGEVLGMVGLADAAGRRITALSTGMRQRLGIATALLGDPPVLLFDEPLHGLDPEGIRWMRTLLQDLAGEGRTVFVSSHVLAELEETAEQVLVIGDGRIVADVPVTRLVAHRARRHVRVVSPDAAELTDALTSIGATVDSAGGGALTVTGIDAARAGTVARERGIRLHELCSRRGSLEDAVVSLMESRR